MHQYQPYVPADEVLRRPAERLEPFESTLEKWAADQRRHAQRHATKRGSVAEEMAPVNFGLSSDLGLPLNLGGVIGSGWCQAVTQNFCTRSRWEANPGDKYDIVERNGGIG